MNVIVGWNHKRVYWIYCELGAVVRIFLAGFVGRLGKEAVEDVSVRRGGLNHYDAGRFPFGVKLQILKYDIVSHIA